MFLPLLSLLSKRNDVLNWLSNCHIHNQFQVFIFRVVIIRDSNTTKDIFIQCLPAASVQVGQTTNNKIKRCCRFFSNMFWNSLATLTYCRCCLCSMFWWVRWWYFPNTYIIWQTIVIGFPKHMKADTIYSFNQLFPEATPSYIPCFWDRGEIRHTTCNCKLINQHCFIREKTRIMILRSSKVSHCESRHGVCWLCIASSWNCVGFSLRYIKLHWYTFDNQSCMGLLQRD